MHIRTERLAHLPATDIGNCVQRQAVVELEMVFQVFPYTVDDKMEKLVLFVQEEGDGQVSNLLFRVLCAGNEINGLEMTEIDVPAENIYVEKLGGVSKIAR
jgi:hypothetical protein